MDNLNTGSTNNAVADLTPGVGNSELDSGLANGLAAADLRSTSRLDNLGLAYQARVTQLTRAVNSLTAQYGSGAPQVIAATAAVTATQSAAGRVRMVKQQTAAVSPNVTATGWAVWGHVYDSQSQPIAGYCVFLVDAQRNYQQTYGFQFTDSHGEYTIDFAGTSRRGAKTAPQPPTVYLAATNAKAQLVFESAKPLALGLGSALYVDMTLAAGEPVLGDLPTEIERVAQPDPNAT